MNQWGGHLCTYAFNIFVIVDEGVDGFKKICTSFESTICREPPTHLRLLPVRHFVGIARFLSPPTCTFSVTKIWTSEALVHVPSLFVMMDEEPPVVVVV